MSHHATIPTLHRRRAVLSRTPFAPLAHAIGACWRSMVRHRATRRDAYFLMSQPDYILRDIGIGRSEIESAVRGRR